MGAVYAMTWYYYTFLSQSWVYYKGYSIYYYFDLFALLTLINEKTKLCWPKLAHKYHSAHKLHAFKHE